MRALGLGLLGIAWLLAGCAPTAAPADAAQPPADLLIRGDGCSTTRLELPAERPREIIVANGADEPMVFTIPRLAVGLALSPGERATLPINPFLMGEFDYFCLDAHTHLELGGHSSAGAFTCPLDPGDLHRAEASGGVLRVEQQRRPGSD